MPFQSMRGVLFAIWIVPALAVAQPAADDLQACVTRATDALPSQPASAVRGIDGLPRQLLALRSYLRAGDVGERWSWTDAEIAAYEQSPAHEEALAALAWAQARFAERNPGYSLYVNTRVRSLDTQLERWNTNASVGVAAEAMARAAAEACAAAPSTFAEWVRGWRPDPPANLAAPGLSAHGQARAFDFQVMQGEVLVAGTDSRRIDADWVEGGWARRLAEVMAESPAFEGPLRSPREPWHYAYAPAEGPSPDGHASCDADPDAHVDPGDAD